MGVLTGKTTAVPKKAMFLFQHNLVLYVINIKKRLCIVPTIW